MSEEKKTKKQIDLQTKLWTEEEINHLQHAWLYLVLIGLIVGILLPFHFLMFFVVGVAVLLFFFISRKKETLYVVLFLFAISLGAFRLDSVSDYTFLYDKYVNQGITIEGVIVTEPDERETHQRLVVKSDEKVLVTTDLFPRFVYGDLVEVSGVILKPENFETDAGRVFDYVSYLQKDDINYQISFAKVSLIESGYGNPVKRFLFSTKSLFLKSVSRVIPEPQSSLLGGLVVGAKQSLGSDLQDKFRKTGIIHIVVLSGYNVTIVAEFIMRIFSFLPFIYGTSIGVISVIFFALMTGASATIVRASIMALLVVLARATGRTHEITRALLFAALIMLIHNPKILLHDPSFQLSFLATIGLIHVSPHIEKYFFFITEKFQLRGFATATVSTQIFVLPLLLYMTGELSLVALPVNLLILVFVPVTMLFGFVTGLVGLLSSVIALPFAFVSYLLLSYELTVVDLFSSIPFASINIPSISIWGVGVIYAIYSVILWKLTR